MSNSDKGKLLSQRRLTLLIIIASILLIAATVIVAKYGWFEKDMIRVDFSDVSPESESWIDIAGDDLPVLRVAVAAMISPESTRYCYDDLLALIGRKLGRRTVFLQRQTYTEINSLLNKKEIDVAFVCSGPYVIGHREFGMKLLVVPVVDGKKTYRSYIIANKHSHIKIFWDLKGKKFAFTDPHSNTGKLVPTYMLALRGETPGSFFGETFYAYGHDNAIQAVAEGLADGAAVDSLVWEFMNATDPTYTKLTKIIEKSPPYGIPPVVVHPDLSVELKQKLKDVFLNLHKDKKAAPLLHLLRIDRFEEGKDAMYDSVRKMQEWLGESEENKT